MSFFSGSGKSTLNCRLCQSELYLEECSFGSAGKAWICARCYNNDILREQIRGKLERLFQDFSAGDKQAREKIISLARQYKLPEPQITEV